jgi:hypothetical protein
VLQTSAPLWGAFVFAVVLLQGLLGLLLAKLGLKRHLNVRLRLWTPFASSTIELLESDKAANSEELVAPEEVPTLKLPN